MDLDEGFDPAADVEVDVDATLEAAAAAAAAVDAAVVAELRLSTALVTDRLRVTRPPAVLPEDAGDDLLLAISGPLVGVTGVVGKAPPPSLETPDRLEPLES